MKKLFFVFAMLSIGFTGNLVQAQWVQTNGPYGGVIPCFAVSGTNLFAGTYGGGVFLSTNNGTSWTEVNNGLTGGTAVMALAVSGTNLFAGTLGGGVFLSTNNGTSWTVVNNGLTDTYVYALAVSGTNLFAGTYNGDIFLSTNNGTSWTAVNTGLTNNTVNSLAVSGTNLFAGTNGGVFLSTNNGTSWTAESIDLTYTIVPTLAVSGTNLFAGTYGGGVWKRPLSEMITSVERSSTDLPTHFNISQNYPNPFNLGTVISYSLPTASDVKLIVYNTIGQTVKTLENGLKNAGNYSINFNAAGLPSGIYFYKLEAGQFSQIKKMILLK